MNDDTGLRAVKVNAKDEGHCNFCSSYRYSTVWSISSNDPHRTLCVRMCNDCRARLTEAR